MMAHKQFLHELLKEDQHPFQLKSYIADKRSRYNDFSPPVIKSPGAAAFLHVPAETAAVLAEAAMRINKPNLKTQIRNARFTLFGPFLNILRSKSKVLRNSDNEKSAENARINSCSCSNHGEDFASRFCSTPVRFSIRSSSPSTSSGRRSPECCSPALPTPMKQEKENYRSGEDSDIVNGEEEEKEQCSPVSILDPFFEDEIVDADEEEDEDEDEEYDLNCSFANIERATQNLLNRLRRFEKLAALDPMELELKLLEDSDNNQFLIENKETYEDKGQGSNTLILPRNRRKMSCETNRFTSELIVEEKNETILSHEHGVIYTMAKLDLKRELERLENIREEVEEKVAEVEQAIFSVLVEELYDELLSGRAGPGLCEGMISFPHLSYKFTHIM